MEIKHYTNELAFIKEILYEAIFWNKDKQPPTFEESLKLDFVIKPLMNWGQSRDTCFIAFVDNQKAGAVWYRFWNKGDEMRGFVDEQTPVLVIGVRKEFQKQGIGAKLIETISEKAREQGLKQISLSVSKENYARFLYEKTGFTFFEDIGDSILMVKRL